MPSDPLPPRCLRLVLPPLTTEQVGVLLDLLNALHLVIWDAYEDEILARATAEADAHARDDVDLDDPLPPT